MSPESPDLHSPEALEYFFASRAMSAEGASPECPDLIDDHFSSPTYEFEQDRFIIHDAVWNRCEIGQEPYDELLLELARTPLFRRLQCVEQLTLGPRYATMPNSTSFTRWEHIWGSLAFVRKMTEGRTDLDEHQKMVLQLRTLLSDVGHTAFSHLGDWLFQGINGGEDLHDSDLKELLHASGIEEMLARGGFTLDETVFPETVDWVECPSPDLCVDRVDYGVREILRWVVPTVPLNLYLHEIQDPKNIFVIDDQQQLVVKSPIMARYLATGFSLLPTEHWSHPVHRLQLELLQSAVRATLVDEARMSSAHPRDALYGIDSDFNAFMQTWDALFLDDTMRDVANWQRRIFRQARRHDLQEVFWSGINGTNIGESDWRFPDFPDPIKVYSWQSRNYTRPFPPHLDIEEDDTITEQRMTVDNRGLVVELPPLKARAIDPLVGDEHSSLRLSELDPSYGPYLQGQRDMMARKYRITIFMRPEVAQQIVARHEAATQQWARFASRERNPQYLIEKINDANHFYTTSSLNIIYGH